MNSVISKLAVAVAVASLAACSGDDGKNGADGSNGSNGHNSLVSQTSLSVGNANCANGGVQINTGVDANDNNTLDDSEVASTQYVCTPARTTLDNSELLTNLNNPWYSAATNKVAQSKANMEEIAKMAGQAKNIILFVGDGMGVSTVTASRIFEGQSMGMLGEEHSLSFGKFPYAGLAKTYNVDAQTPDSAGTMTALMTGVKTDVGVIGVDEDIVRGDCSTVAGNELVTALELAEIAGKSTGIISTARITHATPAATYAKSADRNWEDNSDQPAGTTCEDIASQLINFEPNLEARIAGVDVDGIEVVMGGGRRHFLPKDAAYNSPDYAGSSAEGDRTDGRDLTAEWTGMYANGVYVYDQAGFDAVNPATTERLFGLFNESHMQYEADRGNDVAGEPSLTEMTEKAIDILDNNNDGFFLMVESGRIDHAHHAGNAFGALNDTVEFASAVQAAVNATDAEDTLIIVTADHGHVFTIAGYPKRGNPILGKVVNVGSTEPAMAADDMPYTTLGYTNGLGFRDLGNETDSDASYATSADAGRKDLTSVDTETPGFHQETLVPLSSETHSGEDVGVYAQGPGAHLVSGTHEQNTIFHIMNYAGNLVDSANQAVNLP
ncbi:alkaline phosphatase [Teredinibacter sp. KSP-S5-2]|uniref:alkaline phosphatase n=1 Tax=Teredinibacter sp. KSP-S5-2 TaxID=3034506 RepID=UPI002934878C|nr:alkaline phosphatase [Teredinibacter sp. KSP-S5-2]WNO08723.1 alkaline phosphatase [Teredinibacter sp. KSP-S5-2]